jgi:hypothetical protein
MNEVPEGPTDVVGLEADARSDEIARSLGSVWQRFSGQRPKSTNVEIDQDVVRCVIEERKPTQESDDEDDEATEELRLTSAGLKHNATAAVTRITGRQVVAFIPKRDAKTEVSTQTFLLDRPPRRF